MNNGDGIETIDEFEKKKDAYTCCAAYRIAGYGNIWVSKRATKEWYNTNK